MNGPPTFQRTMHNLLGYGRWDYAMVYLDDILIFSRSFNVQKKHLNEILSILAKANFQVNPDKCCIAVQEIDFLSHTINEQFIKPNGKINWYRKFIADFARTAPPLHKVTHNTKHRRHEFKWGPDQQHLFDAFKRILAAYPLFLEYSDLSTSFITLRKKFMPDYEITNFELRVLLRHYWRKNLDAKAAAKAICDVEGEGDLDLEDRPRSGRPTVLDEGDLQAALDVEPSSSTRELAEELGVDQKKV
ncbi:unnamed protein product [Rotaria socialis]|uniref:Reverse transcriptase domain-containing protein n=1 Tax=Rotaria socialis TaxID=392032 RepID=A0A821ATB7_9BILA|nr:unnamed protein product [Rotaria socialis]CAF4581513.1 unnamed protein product [Rotaria socialis]